MKKKLMEMLAKKEARKKELAAKSEASTSIEEVRSIGVELDQLNIDMAELRSAIDELPDDIDPEGREQNPTAGGGAPEGRGGSPIGRERILGTYGLGGGQPTGGEERNKDLEKKYEQRGADLKAKKSVTYDLDEIPELRATTIGSGNLVTETKFSRSLNPTFNEVSRVIDVVNVIPLIGGESYEQGFEVGVGEGDYTAEGADYTETDPKFDYVSIGKAKITAYTEMSEEAMKLPNVDYQSRVRDSITKAIRKKISRQILVGAGGANAITGIFNAPSKVIPTSTDLTISEIDADTLDKIVIGYGGDEEVEGMGYLILNKQDLAAFAAVRATDGKKLYKIKTTGNTGTISSEDSFEVPFIINSVCPPLSASGTAANTYCMAYGMMMGYELPVFSALTVEESRDFKFKSGQVAYRGSIWVGGNTAMYKGFVRVKKVTAT